MIISNHLFLLLLTFKTDLITADSQKLFLTPKEVNTYWDNLKHNSAILYSCVDKAYMNLCQQIDEPSDLKLLNDICSNKLNSVYTGNYNVSRIDTKCRSLINRLYYNFLLELHREYIPPKIKDSREKYNAWLRETAFKTSVFLSREIAKNESFIAEDTIMSIINSAFFSHKSTLIENLHKTQGKSPPTEASLRRKLRRRKYFFEPLHSFERSCCLYYLLKQLSEEKIIKKYK